MQLGYGSYLHAVGECAVSITKSVNEENGRPYSETHTWTIDGQLQGTSLTDIAARVILLENAYAYWGLNMSLIEISSGIILHKLFSAGSITGVQIIQPPHYPKGDGAQGTTFRDYRIVARCEYPYTIGTSGIGAYKSYRETLSGSGGYPERTMVKLLNGPPQIQTLCDTPGFEATQVGAAVGYLGYPPVPPPIWPIALMEAGKFSYEAPTLKNGIYTDWPVTWSYRFGSTVPLVGLPNLQPFA